MFVAKKCLHHFKHTRSTHMQCPVHVLAAR